ncbi:MAG TPA: S41 family peptidase [Thermoflexales bacterium]|nr:S41 family peptidase [Thermoflexales bacterium]HQZ21523.1 S41 family peptidase [Thermoflexales bacterium]HQZ99516.1 S41 family peptidase [Thermoflexales bacterium]
MEQPQNHTLRNIVMSLLGLFIGGLIFVTGLAVGAVGASTLRAGNAAVTAPPVVAPSTGGSSAATAVPSTSATSSGLNQTLMNDVMSRLRKQWYGDIPSNDALTDGAIRGMVNSLGDPFTAYVEPKYAKMLEDDTSGSFEGIGATLKQLPNGGGVQIIKVFDGSPAQKAGVQAGDIIQAVDGVNVTNLNTTEVAALVRGKKGSAVTLKLLRADSPKAFELKITRGTIVIPVTTNKVLGDGKIAYISLYDFSAQASTQMKTDLAKLLKDNPKGLILDLRDNPGGLLSQAVDVGDIFLKKGVFVIERDYQGNKKETSTTDAGIAQDVPLVVLVNGGSASAAEILAGAIQDYGRGKLIGETTYGKGSVQQPQTLSNGGQLRVTIEHWFTPKDRAIHGTGIAPDFNVPLTADDRTANKDPQLDAAVNYLLTGKTP